MYRWSNISKSLADGWCTVQMTVRPPCASDLSKDTHWKQEALSRPLQVQTEGQVLEVLETLEVLQVLELSERQGAYGVASITLSLKCFDKPMSLTPGQILKKCVSGYLIS